MIRGGRSKLAELTEVLLGKTADDCGNSPTFGTLVDLSPEEVVIKPAELETPALIDVRVHFPRLGFVVQPVREAKL